MKIDDYTCGTFEGHPGMVFCGDDDDMSPDVKLQILQEHSVIDIHIHVDRLVMIRDALSAVIADIPRINGREAKPEIIVNGEKRHFSGTVVSYSQILACAGFDPEQAVSVMYRKGPRCPHCGHEPSGILNKGEVAEVADGTTFTAMVT